jgi:signal transduction histidine kinase
LKNYERALDYYQKSLQLKNEAKDNYDKDRLLINIGLCYIHLKDFKKSLDAFDQAFKMCQNECADQIKIEGEGGLGVAYYGLENYLESQKHLEIALSLAKENDNQRFQAENLVYLGRVAIKLSDYESAKKYLTETEQIADSSGYNQLLIDTYKEFSRLYTLTNDFQNASYYQNKYIHLKDSLIGEELVKNIAKIQTQFEERENLATIQLKEDALKRQRNLNIAIGVIAMLAALLGFVLYRSNAVMRRVNSELTDAKSVIENQNLRLQNINRELDARVKEKTSELLKMNDELDRANKSLSQVNDELDNFIYKTSHDIRGPLASLKGICSVALMDVKDPLALDYLSKLDVSSCRLNVILTRLLIVNQINNAIVGKEPIDFNSMVEDIILLENKKGLPPKIVIKKDIQPNISFQSDKDLVRIILENLIDNAIKFYNDSERIQPFVHIKIGIQDAKEVVVQVIDNGIGIAEAKPNKIFQMFSRASERSGTGGIGLYLSKLATEKLGGRIQLRTSPEGYTEFYVSFPIWMPEA